MRGVLTGGLPSTLEVEGEHLPIYTDWRVWIDVWRVVDNPTVDQQKKAIALLGLIFPRTGGAPTPFDTALEHSEAAIEAAILFLGRKRKGDEERPRTRREQRLATKHLLDWDWDAERLVADFEREYRIDLTNPDTSLHWWRFMALFSGLSDTSQMMEAISTRAADLDDKKLGKEERKALRERKAAVMLPARTPQEAAENRRVRGR